MMCERCEQLQAELDHAVEVNAVMARHIDDLTAALADRKKITERAQQLAERALDDSKRVRDSLKDTIAAMSRAHERVEAVRAMRMAEAAGGKN